MNFSDSEIIASIMAEHGFGLVDSEHEAQVMFINTCAIRENAEQRIRERLKHLRNIKNTNGRLVIGVLGCMAERLKEQLLEQEKLVDIVAGPDSYRELPALVARMEDDGHKSVEVMLSLEETYADIAPIRLNTNGITAFISIMRGCDNMCSFCVVPFTRGRERSRNPESIVEEAKDLAQKGFKEITLLGQNVDSYLWFGGGPKKEFKNLTDEERTSSVNFSDLLEKVALAVPEMRIRFSTSHPKDITDEVLHTMARIENVAKHIHLPAQSGSSRILDLMNRTYTREWYMDRVRAIREILPQGGITCDIITGFCTETEDDHKETLSLMEWSGFDFSYMYKYSERPGTMAARKLQDDIDESVKQRRLEEVIKLQSSLSKANNEKYLSKIVTVLAEGTSKKSSNQLTGRNEQNIKTVFDKKNHKPGDFVKVLITDFTSATLIGEAID